jgi:hypothetical protein
MSVRKRAIIASSVLTAFSLFFILYGILWFYRSSLEKSELVRVEGVIESVEVKQGLTISGKRNSFNIYFLDLKLNNKSIPFSIPSEYKNFSLNGELLIGDTIKIYLDPTALPRTDKRKCGIILIEKNDKLIFSESMYLFKLRGIVALGLGGFFFLVGLISYFTNRPFF